MAPVLSSSISTMGGAFHLAEVGDLGAALARHALALACEDLRDHAVERRAHLCLLAIHQHGLELGIACRGQGNLSLTRSISPIGQFPRRTIMCELTAALMMGVSGARTMLGAAQQAQQAQLEAAQLSRRAWQASYQTAYQAAQARNAAMVSEYNAQDAERRGAVEEERQRTKTSLLLGSQQARFAAQGSDLEGSPFDVLGDTAALGEQDALATRYQTAREAWSQRIQAANRNAEADFLTASLPPWTAAPDPGLAIGRSLLGGATDLFGIAERRNLLPKPPP